MNQKLQQLLDSIRQSAQLSDDEKNALLKSVKEVDKEMEITSFKLDRTEKVKRTTAILLEETIEELEQKRKAVEAQNRELEIETSLERVRTVAMSMHRPDDMPEVCKAIALQLHSLGVKEIRNVQTAIFYQERGTYMNYEFYAKHDKTTVTETAYTNHKVPKAFAEQMLKGKGEVYITHIKDKEVKDWIAYQKSTNVFIDSFLEGATSLNYYWHSLGPVALGISTYHPLGIEELQLFQRFLKVFDLSYRRYLDIEQAIAQAREAQIQLALERVRAKTMAMHQSNELADTASVLFQQIKELGFELWSCGFCIWKENDHAEVWMNNDSGGLLPAMMIPYKEEPTHRKIYEASLRGDAVHEYVWEGEELEKHYKFLQTIPSVKEAINILKKSGLSLPSKQCYYVGFFKQGYLLLINKTPKAETSDLTNRFARVFEQTYTRFLDLQKAEAQSREAQIEASLEKVRAVAMSMMKSEDLLNVCESVFTQVVALGFTGLRAAQVYIRNDETEKFTNYDYSDILGTDIVEVSYNSHPKTRRIYDSIKNAGDAFLENVVSNEELAAWKSYLYDKLGQKPEKSLDEATELHYYFYSVGTGALALCTFTSLSNDQLEILKRFRNVFNLCYQRYTDIALAEDQAREAKIEAALERVRSRTLAMQKSDELAETAAVLFQQLIALGIEPNRLYISIVKDDKGKTEFWITDEDGSKVSTAFAANMNNNVTFQKMYEGWKQQKKSLVINMQGEELTQYFNHLSGLGVPFIAGLIQKRRVQDIAYFSKGFIGIASMDEQPPETLALLERFATVFNLTFTRFNDLKIAEAHARQADQDLIAIKEAKQKAEAALTELQATQAQLIQSEKMASLGELTAGIAHEIQNPLNFVNNFSEVSNELMDEMNAEIEKGDMEEAKAIANDIKHNLEKILHHGKRADGIVKGMLQHSRSSTGAKEPTDINKLADEYLRLAYHGLRAKDKSFNATLKTDYDESIGSINIIPQDIGRVILNLITNAFYAAPLPPEGGFSDPDYVHSPTVWLSTKKSGDKVLISVRDNGPGIPAKILDKIFQPFFTTKPTGQGTGLGLSLSYDIVKAHGGELKVETKEGEGTELIIQIPNSL